MRNHKKAEEIAVMRFELISPLLTEDLILEELHN